MNKQSGTAVVWVVVAVVAVLAVLGIILYSNPLVSNTAKQQDLAQVKKRNVQRMTDVSRIRTAIALYEDNQDEFPGSYPETLDVLVPQYLDVMPSDPLDNRPYGYIIVPSDVASYHLWAQLEDGDPNLATDSDFDSSEVGGVNGGLEACDTRENCIYDYFSN